MSGYVALSVAYILIMALPGDGDFFAFGFISLAIAWLVIGGAWMVLKAMFL